MMGGQAGSRVCHSESSPAPARRHGPGDPMAAPSWGGGTAVRDEEIRGSKEGAGDEGF